MGTGCSVARSASLVQLNKENIPNYKIILIGDPGVGKTNILLRYTKNQFDFTYKPTDKATIESVVRKLNVPANMVVSVTLWDLPGREDMDLRSTYYKNADAVLVVVDMSDEDSIEMAITWRQDFLNKASRTREVVETLPSGITSVRLEIDKDFDARVVPMLLLGNKYDLVEDRMREDDMKKMLEEKKPLEELRQELIAAPVGFKDGEKAQYKLNNEDDVKSSDNKMVDQNENEELVAAIDQDEGGIECDSSDDEGMDHLSGQQKESEYKLACVEKLMKLQTEKVYVSSVIVSAKDTDGSVDVAIQSLVRHLLNSSNIIPKKASNKKSEEKKKKKAKRPKKKGFQPLKTSGVKEIDSLFARSNAVLKRIHEYTLYYDVALNKFKQGCADQGLLSEERASLEDCIVAVRDTVKKRMGRQLMVIDEEDFLRLHYDVNEDKDQVLFKQLRLFLKLLDDFHNEYCAISRAVVKESPTLESLLDTLDTAIAAQAEEMWTGTFEKSYIAHVCDVCEKNRARIAHARLKVAENLKTVEMAREKVRVALMW